LFRTFDLTSSTDHTFTSATSHLPCPLTYSYYST
jgi:hypothetical protein